MVDCQLLTRALRDLALLLGASEQDCDDLVQDALLLAFEQGGEGGEIIRVAQQHLCALIEIWQQAPALESDRLDCLRSIRCTRTPLDTLLFQEEQAILRQAIDELECSRQRFVVHCYLDQMSLKAIGLTLNAGEARMYQVLKGAAAPLRAALEEWVDFSPKRCLSQECIRFPWTDAWRTTRSSWIDSPT